MGTNDYIHKIGVSDLTNSGKVVAKNMFWAQK